VLPIAYRFDWQIEDADVFGKGQVNYETLSQQGPKVFFLLQAKCPVIARDQGVEAGSRFYQS
jgi:hypothetical protein